MSTGLIHFKVETCASIDPVGIAQTVFGKRRHLVVLHKGKNENPHWHFQGELDCLPAKYEETLKNMAEGHSKKIANPKSRPVKRAKKSVDDLGFQYMMKEPEPHVVCSEGFSQEELDNLHWMSESYVDQCKNQLYYYMAEKLEMQKFKEKKRRVRVIDVPARYVKARYESGLRKGELIIKDGEQVMRPVDGSEKAHWEDQIEQVPDGDLEPKEVHKKAKVMAYEFYLEQNKMPPPNFQKLVLWHMGRICQEKANDKDVFKEYISNHL